MIVTDPDPQGSTYRVFHDSRPLSSVLHNNVVMAIDMPDYLFSLDIFPHEVLATTWLQYNFPSKQWRLYAQLLKAEGNEAQYRVFRPEQSGILQNHFSRQPGEHRTPDIEGVRMKLQDEMEKLVRTINTDMRALAPHWPGFDIPEDQDGPFTDFDRMSDATVGTNAAVARTQALRERLNQMENWLRNCMQYSYTRFFDVIAYLILLAVYKDGDVRKTFPTIYSVRDRSITIDMTYLWWLKKNRH